MINPFVADALLNWVNDVGENLVLEAMKRALKRGKCNWGYLRAILQAWVKKGITSVEAAKTEEVEFRRKRHGQKHSVVGTEEVVPDWFKEQKRKKKLKREREKPEWGLRDLVAEQVEVEKLLEAYRSGKENRSVV